VIVLILIIAAMVGVVATYVIQARHEERDREAKNAFRGPTRVAGVDGPIAAEELTRGNSPPGQGHSGQ
jgi:hypothetical protein